jgi:hypothetical protein
MQSLVAAARGKVAGIGSSGDHMMGKHPRITYPPSTPTSARAAASTSSHVRMKSVASPQ